MHQKEPKTAPIDTMFNVRSASVEAGNGNELDNCKKSGNRNRSKPRDTLAQPAPESTADRLAQKPTSGRASSPAGSPKPATVAAPSAGTVAVKGGKLMAIPESSGESAEIFFYPDDPKSAWSGRGLSIASVKRWNDYNGQTFDLYRSPVMQPDGARAFRWVTVGKGSEPIARATARALKIVAKNLTAYGWTVEILTAKK